MSAIGRLDQIEARANAATGGSWNARNESHSPGSDRWIVEVWPNMLADLRKMGAQGGNDATFIAHARTDVPALISAVRVALNNHTPSHPIHGIRYCQTCNDPWPCEEIRDITEALA